MRPVLHLTNVHSPDNYRVYDREIRTLTDAEFNVYYIVPGAKTEKKEGVQFIGIKKFENEWKRALITGWQLFREVLRFPANSIVHFHSPEWIPFGILAKLAGRTVTYDVHEDVPRQVYTKVWIPAFLKPIIATVISILEWIMFKIADRIVACESVTYRRFSAPKTILLRNFPLMEEFQKLPDTKRSKNKIVYVGQIFRERGILELIEALEKVDSKLDVQLVLGGKFVPGSLLDECKMKKGWERVDFRGYMSRDAVTQALAEARAGMLVLHPIRKYRESYPVKLFEYMAAGLPIIMSDFPKWKESVGTYDVYWTVNPLDTDSIARGIEKALTETENHAEKASNGRRAFLNEFNWDLEKVKLIKMYKELNA